MSDKEKKTFTDKGNIKENSSNSTDAFASTMQGGFVDTGLIPKSSADAAAPANGKIKPPKKSPNKTILWILISCFVLLAGLAGVYSYTYFQNQKYLEAIDKDTYYEGIFVDNVSLGGLTKSQAEIKIKALQKVNESHIKVTVIWDETQEYVFSHEDVNISYDTDKVLDEAYKTGREGTDAERYRIVTNLLTSNMHFATTRSIDPSPIEDTVRDIALSKAANAAEPAVQFNPDEDIPKEEWFVYSDPVSGIETDDEALWKSVKQAFEDETFGVIDVPKWEIPPDENINFRDITQQIVSFKTVQSRNANREHNIALACSMINGTVVMPGEEFSMNTTTGKRTASAGFKEANTIVGGNELVPDIAGGVCQVSGTLFNAALRADLEITERFHHSFELGYLTRGRDATVNYGTADLKFINTHDYPIYIAMYTDGRDVYAEIYGAPLESCDHITLRVKTTKTIDVGDAIYKKDSEVPVGAEPVLVPGRRGITCEVYRIYRDENDEQIASEYLYTDVYRHYYPELHVNPEDYEGYINPTPEPTVEPTPTPSPEPTPTPTATPDGGA